MKDILEIPSKSKKKKKQTSIQEKASQSIVDNLSGSQNTVNLEEEMLKQGFIPPETLYEGIGGEILNEMDGNINTFYTAAVNFPLAEMFQWLFTSDCEYSAPFFSEHFGKLTERIDIGTGNGRVTDQVGSYISLSHFRYRTKIISKNEQLLSTTDNPEERKELIKELEELTKIGELKLTACDLSSRSLQLAKDLYNKEFQPLEEYFNIQYCPQKFQTILKPSDEKPKLITMLNFLANFGEKELREILTQMHNSMGPNDIFIPTFFLVDEKINYQKSYTPFRNLGKDLYDNPETKNWIKESIATKYELDPLDIAFHVEWKNDGRDYIEVSVSISRNCMLSLPDANNEKQTLSAKTIQSERPGIRGVKKLIAFKSYRMTKGKIEKICRECGFEIDNRLESHEGGFGTGTGLQGAPILYKKERKYE